MALYDLGAPASVHPRLKSLREKGWVAYADTEDARRKQVELTEPALRFLDTIAMRLLEVAKHNTP